jgi:hypothetical protein
MDRTNAPTIPLVACAAIYVALAGIATASHYHFVDIKVSTLLESFARNVLEGRVAAPEQFRILLPILSDRLVDVGAPPMATWLGLRFSALVICAALFHRFLATWFDRQTCVMGTLAFFAFLPITYVNYHVSVTDPSNLAFTLGALILIEQRRDGWLAALLAISVMNRETMILVPLLWLLYRWDELPPVRCALVFLGYCAIVLGVHFAVRAHFGLRPNYANWLFGMAGYDRISLNLRWRALLYFALYLAPLGAIAAMSWRRSPKFLRRALLFVPFFVAFHFLMAMFAEIRLMLPVFPVVAAAALCGLAPCHIPEEPEPQTWQWIRRHAGLIYAVGFIGFILLAIGSGDRLIHTTVGGP